MALPIGVAPTGRHAQAHPQGEEATAKGLLLKLHTIFKIQHKVLLPVNVVGMTKVQLLIYVNYFLLWYMQVAQELEYA